MPPPTINQTAARIKKTFPASFFRLTIPSTKNTKGGPNVIENKIATKIPIPSIMSRLRCVNKLSQILCLVIPVKKIHGFKGNYLAVLVDDVDA